MLGWSLFSDNLRVGLGPLPSKVTGLQKSSDESLSSPSSLHLEWSPLLSQTLTPTHYSLYMDDGFGVTYTLLFEDDCTEYLVTDLAPGIAYSFYLTASNFNGVGTSSDIVKLKACISP